MRSAAPLRNEPTTSCATIRISELAQRAVVSGPLYISLPQARGSKLASRAAPSRDAPGGAIDHHQAVMVAAASTASPLGWSQGVGLLVRRSGVFPGAIASRPYRMGKLFHRSGPAAPWQAHYFATAAKRRCSPPQGLTKSVCRMRCYRLQPYSPAIPFACTV